MFWRTNQTNLRLLFGVMRVVFLPGISRTKAKRLTVLSDFIPCHFLSVSCYGFKARSHGAILCECDCDFLMRFCETVLMM